MTVGFNPKQLKISLEQLQQQDASIERIIICSEFVKVHFLQLEGPTQGWREASIEGPLYLVRRRMTPRYQLIVKNELESNVHLVDMLHPEWEVEGEKNYIFYKPKG